MSEPATPAVSTNSEASSRAIGILGSITSLIALVGVPSVSAALLFAIPYLYANSYHESLGVPSNAIPFQPTRFLSSCLPVYVLLYQMLLTILSIEEVATVSGITSTPQKKYEKLVAGIAAVVFVASIIYELYKLKIVVFFVLGGVLLGVVGYPCIYFTSKANRLMCAAVLCAFLAAIVAALAQHDAGLDKKLQRFSRVQIQYIGDKENMDTYFYLASDDKSYYLMTYSSVGKDSSRLVFLIVPRERVEKVQFELP